MSDIYFITKKKYVYLPKEEMKVIAECSLASIYKVSRAPKSAPLFSPSFKAKPKPPKFWCNHKRAKRFGGNGFGLD